MTDGKILYLMRHAESSWSGTGFSDVERPLNECGFRDAVEMGRRLKARGSMPDIVLCSPAKRARQTLEHMQLNPPDIGMDDRLYEASMGQLLAVIQSLKTSCNSALLIGHNPSMTWLINQISGEQIQSMPTGAMATIELNSADWKRAGACPAGLRDFDYPGKTD